MKTIILLSFITLLLSTCNQPDPAVMAAQESTQVRDSIKPTGLDSASGSKEAITNAYCQAIAAFIQAVHDKHNTRFDTLYFGKHVYGQPDDFPDIALPKTIERTEVRLINPEVGASLQKERKSLVYINLMGWVNPEKAEFLFVTFSNGGAHQYDCYIHYKTNAATQALELENLRFEYFLYKSRH